MIITEEKVVPTKFEELKEMIGQQRWLRLIYVLVAVVVIFSVGLVVISRIDKQRPETVIPEFTGAVGFEVTDNQLEIRRQYNRLLDELVPVKTGFFTIEFSYNLGKFVVVLKEPYKQSKESFEQWLKDNELNMIESDSIKFLLE